MDTSDNAERGYRYSVKEAEHLTGFTQQQISRIGTRLKDRNAFRLALFGAAYHKAMAEANTTATKWTGGGAGECAAAAFRDRYARVGRGQRGMPPGL